MIATFLLFLLGSALPGRQTGDASVSPEAMQHVQAGVELEKHGDFDRAIKQFQEVTRLAPGYDLGFLNLGDAYMKKGDYGKAIPPLKKAAELNRACSPGNGTALFLNERSG